MPVETDFRGNIERFSGFADDYDKYRQKPPDVLSEILCRFAGLPFPKLVVDLGSGTGLSTRYWADKAEQVIGVDPTPDMLRQAEQLTSASNISYREGLSHQTGLPDHCADIVTCSQALHWMEPQATFEEAARILRSGGVFAAYDGDWPPTTGHWEAEAAFTECIKQVDSVFRDYYPKLTPIKIWNKAEHLARMQSSGQFRYAKDIVLHHAEPGNAERLIGLLLSQGSVMTLRKAGFTDEQLGIDTFRKIAEQTLGSQPETWYWSSRVRFGVV